MRWFRPRAPVDPCRWLVVDTETSGLDPRSDRLLAIAAVALRIDWPRGRLAIDIGDSFETVLQQQDAPADKDNILLHGIGVGRQHAGVPQPQALRDFAGYVRQSPLLAFHAGFDDAVIARHARRHGQPVPGPWLDIAQLCAATHPDTGPRTLDDWMGHLGIVCRHRHQASADAWAECEVLLRIWPRVAAQCRSWADVVRLAAVGRWLMRAGARPA